MAGARMAHAGAFTVVTLEPAHRFLLVRLVAPQPLTASVSAYALKARARECVCAVMADLLQLALSHALESLFGELGRAMALDVVRCDGTCAVLRVAPAHLHSAWLAVSTVSAVDNQPLLLSVVRTASSLLALA